MSTPVYRPNHIYRSVCLHKHTLAHAMPNNLNIYTPPHLTFSTFHTLHSTPHTPHPTPHTPYPTPHTPHPTLSTPHFTHPPQVLDSPWEGPSAASQAVWEGPLPPPTTSPLLTPHQQPPSDPNRPPATDAANACTTAAPAPVHDAASGGVAGDAVAPSQQQQGQQGLQGSNAHGGVFGGAQGYKPRGLKGPLVNLYAPSLVIDVSATYPQRAEACQDVLREFMFAIPKVCLFVCFVSLCLWLCVLCVCVCVCVCACVKCRTHGAYVHSTVMHSSH